MKEVAMYYLYTLGLLGGILLWATLELVDKYSQRKTIYFKED